MNANELIEYLETHDYCEGDVKNSIDMLRQQQAEIEALKTFIKERTWFDVEAILRKAQEK